MNPDPEKLEVSDSLQHQAEHERPHGTLSVKGYMAILFGFAFMLMLLSYFMQRRTSDELLSGVKDSVSALQYVESLQVENVSLKQQVETLETQLGAYTSDTSGLNTANSTLTSQNETLAKQLEAMDWFWRIQREYYRGNDENALDYLEGFQDAGLVEHLPTEHPASPDGLSPAEQFVNLLDALT